MPFIVEGNTRDWVPVQKSPDNKTQASAKGQYDKVGHGDGKILSAQPRNFKVTTWIFTEAQCGKDQLDCHFSFIRRVFDRWIAMSGNKLANPEHMFNALSHPPLAIKNTNVLYGSTKHPALKKKFALPSLRLKIQSVHEYAYFTSGRVEITHHGGIETKNMKTSCSFNINGDAFKNWIKNAGFQVVP